MPDKMTLKEVAQRMRMTVVALTNWPCTHLGMDDREWMEIALRVVEREAEREAGQSV